MSFLCASHNGEVIPYASAVVPLDNIAYAYGYGVYETLRVKGGLVQFASDHVERLLFSAEQLGLAHQFSRAQFFTALDGLAESIKVESYNLKIMLIGGTKSQNADLWIIPLAPLFPDKKLYTQGATASTVAYERLFPSAKTLNMLPSYLYYSAARASGCYDVLFVDSNKNITEGSRTNFFAMQGTTIISPPKSTILEGVMRKHVLLAALESGFTVQEQPVKLAELGNYSAAFLTSTSSKIMPLSQIDLVHLPISQELKKLMSDFDIYYEQHAFFRKH